MFNQRHLSSITIPWRIFYEDAFMFLAGKTAVHVGIGFDKNIRQAPNNKGDV